MQSLSIYTAPELSNADTGVPIVTLDENLSNNYPCLHLCTWMHNNVQNNCNHCAVKFGCTKKSHYPVTQFMSLFCTKIIMVQLFYVSKYNP